MNAMQQQEPIYTAALVWLLCTLVELTYFGWVFYSEVAVARKCKLFRVCGLTVYCLKAPLYKYSLINVPCKRSLTHRLRQPETLFFFLSELCLLWECVNNLSEFSWTSYNICLVAFLGNPLPWMPHDVIWQGNPLSWMSHDVIRQGNPSPCDMS